MDILNVVLSGFLFSFALMMLFTGAYSYFFKKNEISKLFACFCTAVAVYSFGYGLELRATTLGSMLRWNALKYLGLPFIPAFWLLIAVHYTNREKFLNPYAKAFIFALSVTIIIFRYTNQWHHLYYTSVEARTDLLFPILYVEKGPWYVVYGAYLTFSVIAASYFYFMQCRNTYGSLKAQCRIMFFASIPPWLTFFLNFFNVSPYAIDWGPFVGSISCIMFYVAMFKYDFLDLRPLAKDMFFKYSKSGIIVLDTQGYIVDFNDSAKRIFKNLKENGSKQNIHMVLEDEDFVRRLFAGEEAQGELESEGRHYSLKSSKLTDEKGNVVEFLITASDVTNYVFAMRNLFRLAAYDELTGVYNRRYLFEQCEKELERARKENYCFSCVIFDLDFFKDINDEYGHQAGDYVLKCVSEICKRNLRSSDIFGRYGGEEFIVFLPNTALKDAVFVARRVQRSIEAAEIVYEGKRIKVTASFGVAGVDTLEKEDLDTFLKWADEALYKAKTEGRNRICVASISTH
ncbi:MAG: diguanylate cyclase [Clostridia bacterium]|nr:diguanylate cyclase [Clostridia bacterium]